MSAIFGIFCLDGRPLDREKLERMSSSLSHRGSDSADVWGENNIGLGHRMLWTTPESLQEQLPLTNKSGTIILTADARIDNREELIAAVNLVDAPAVEISDSALILAAYEKWGERCPERLLGDFAFILWDHSQRKLFCARDHFGLKPLYYFYRPGRLFVCASEIKGLFVLPEIPRQLNEVQVANYLADIFEDKASTFYDQILRLPPAHCLAITSHKIRMRSYWALDASTEIRYGSDDDYAAAYRKIFTEAVRCRLRSAFPIGSHLSGGLDSSSVTCTAGKLLEETKAARLHTFSNIFDDVPECDERPFINSVLAHGGFVPHYIHADRSSPLAELESVFSRQDEPCIGPNHFLPWQLNRAAAEAGVRIVLDGFDGDTTVSHGAARFAELAHAGDWETFAQEAGAVACHFPVSPLGLLRSYGLAPLEKMAKRQRWLAFADTVNQINRTFHLSRRELLWEHGLKPLIPLGIVARRHRHPRGIDPIINSDFAYQVGLGKRIKTLNADRSNPPRTAREDQWRSLTSGLFPLVLELSDRCAGAFAIDARHPFMDKRLIEYCLALPADQKLYQGWSRIVMRRALTGILPEEICWRGGKTDMNPSFLRGFLTADRKVLDEVVFHPTESVRRYINTEGLKQVYTRLVCERKAQIEDAMSVWKAATLSCWLRFASFGTGSDVA